MENQDKQQLDRSKLMDGIPLLIGRSISTVEADKIIQDTFPELAGEDTVDILKAKISILEEAYGVKIGSMDEECSIAQLAEDYYYFLSRRRLARSPFAR